MTDDSWLRELLSLQKQRSTLNEDEQLRLRKLLCKFCKRENWDAGLQFFWLQLDTLVEISGAWDLCYSLIFEVLKSGRFSEYKGMPGTPEEYIQDFITRKIFEPADRLTGARIHAGALQQYYRRFLLSQIARNGHHAVVVEKEDEEGTAISLLDLILGSDNKHSHSATAWRAMTTSQYDIEKALAEVGLSVAKVTKAADAFLTSLKTLDGDWGRVLLKCSACADREQHFPIARFKGRITNHNYRARQLGIIPGGTQFPDYRRTKIGRWLLGQGLRLDTNFAEAIESALKILCWQTLTSVDIDCTRYRLSDDD